MNSLVLAEKTKFRYAQLADHLAGQIREGVWQAGEQLPSVRQMSQLQGSADGAYVVFVQGKLPLDEAKVAISLPTFEQSMRQRRRTEAFNSWFNTEFNKVKTGIPYFQQQAQVSGAPNQ